MRSDRADHPISYLDTLIKTGSEEADLVRGVCGAPGGHDTAEVRDVWRTGGGCGLLGGPGKRVNEVFPGRPQLSASTPTTSG